MQYRKPSTEELKVLPIVANNIEERIKLCHDDLRELTEPLMVMALSSQGQCDKNIVQQHKRLIARNAELMKKWKQEMTHLTKNNPDFLIKFDKLVTTMEQDINTFKNRIASRYINAETTSQASIFSSGFLSASNASKPTPSASATSDTQPIAPVIPVTQQPIESKNATINGYKCSTSSPENPSLSYNP